MTPLGKSPLWINAEGGRGLLQVESLGFDDLLLSNAIAISHHRIPELKFLTTCGGFTSQDGALGEPTIERPAPASTLAPVEVEKRG